MATYYCNDVSTTSTSMNTSAANVSQASTYVIEIEDMWSGDFGGTISFYDVNGNIASYSQSNIEQTHTWSIKGDMNYAYRAVENGYFEYGDAGPAATYGYVTKAKYTFPNVPSTVSYISIDFYDDDAGTVDNTRYWYLKPPYSHAGAPTSPTLAATISREAVELSWGAGSAGTNNSVTGYDVQYRESSDGSSWGSWTTASGSPVTATKLSVSPSTTVGNYRQYRVRTRGSAGEEYYSGWVTSTNTLRRKWAAFGAWTDPTLTAGVSGIRAIHLTQLQERANTIRTFYGLAAYSFTTVTPKVTKIAKWASLIQEIREAIDAITTSHEAWNTLEAGKPRIAHITQLRSIIDNM